MPPVHNPLLSMIIHFQTVFLNFMYNCFKIKHQVTEHLLFLTVYTNASVPLSLWSQGKSFIVNIYGKHQNNWKWNLGFMSQVFLSELFGSPLFNPVDLKSNFNLQTTISWQHRKQMIQYVTEQNNSKTIVISNVLITWGKKKYILTLHFLLFTTVSCVYLKTQGAALKRDVVYLHHFDVRQHPSAMSYKVLNLLLCQEPWTNLWQEHETNLRSRELSFFDL